KGELIFLIGKNGSGKSTFCMLLTGLFKPSEGEIFIDDMKIDDNNLDVYRSLVSAVFSDFHLFTKTLAKEKFADEEKITSWLEFLELKGKTRVEDHELVLTKLSTGQKKRLAMLIALLEERDILVLDEWAADQDPVFRRFFYKKLLPLLKEQGKTIFAITHDDAYFDSADRIFLAEEGNISELKGENIKELARNLVEKFD
ncbi:ATP-binding cassette domain-containing protein, partial [Campylobacter coli]|nr:ATP-binding cassette domain-containing protein [Campylobacter coli]